MAAKMPMSRESIERIRKAVLDRHYAFSEHAYDEMSEDDLDALDVEAAILTGRIEQEWSDDVRGRRFEVIGTACDLSTEVGVVVRFVERSELLVITVYQIKG